MPTVFQILAYLKTSTEQKYGTTEKKLQYLSLCFYIYRIQLSVTVLDAVHLKPLSMRQSTVYLSQICVYTLSAYPIEV